MRENNLTTNQLLALIKSTQAGTVQNYRAVVELCKRATAKRKIHRVTRQLKRGEGYVTLEDLSFDRFRDADDMFYRLVGVSLANKPLTTVVEIDTESTAEYRISTVEVKDLLIIKMQEDLE